MSLAESMYNGFFGGMLLGAAAAIALLGAGEIMGFSGIISPFLKDPIATAQDPSQQWKVVFLASYFIAAYFVFLPYADMDRINSVASMTSAWGYTLSGIMTGLGTKLGSGCTTGHGICGMARLSKRSLSAVLSFMSTAIATTVITSSSPYFAFLRNPVPTTPDYVPSWVPFTLTVLVATTALYGARSVKALTPQQANKRIPIAISAVVAAAGLTRSSMVYPEAVRSFLNVQGIPTGTWNPTLMMVMMGGLLVSTMAYQLIPNHAFLRSCPKLAQPLSGGSFGVPTLTVIDAKLLLGAATFGIGWGVTGVCPGSALLLTMTGLSGMVYQWWPAFYIGNRIGEAMKASM